MSMNITDIYKYAYVPIEGVPEYVDFEFSLNWVAIYAFITVIYSIPCTVVLIQLQIFHLKTKKTGGIFNAFVQMQLLITLHGLADFLAVRVPGTGVFTQYCAAEDPQWYMRSSVFLYYATSYSSQLLTVMFCVMRVVYLYFPAYVQEKFEAYFNITSLLITILSFLVALPHLLSTCVCLQLFRPYPFGALVILSMFHYGNLIPFNFSLFVFTSSVMVAILISAYFMFRKLGERRKMSVVTKSSYNMKAERTLSMTILLILIPLIFIQVMSIGEVLNHPLLSYLVLIRPIVDDWRIHIVTQYFFFTHPALKKQKVSVVSTVSGNAKSVVS